MGRSFLNDGYLFPLFCSDYYPVKKSLAFYLTKFQFILIKDALAKSEWIWPNGSGE